MGQLGPGGGDHRGGQRVRGVDLVLDHDPPRGLARYEEPRLVPDPPQVDLGWYCGYYKGHKTLKFGSSGQAVKEVQANINQTTDYKPKLKVDGQFGSKTKKAVLWFQHEFKIKPYDGIVGPKTWKVLRAK
ncbi:peptidoglycan-binding protein [Streptomyces sp. NPDC050759]|uniref:peptidoglycan-binding protein n=1 Tax=Streptomyces sp. NPDC050759 TaxID=3365635 RepID=UPI0037A71F13